MSGPLREARAVRGQNDTSPAGGRGRLRRSLDRLHRELSRALRGRRRSLRGLGAGGPRAGL